MGGKSMTGGFGPTITLIGILLAAVGTVLAVASKAPCSAMPGWVQAVVVIGYFTVLVGGSVWGLYESK